MADGMASPQRILNILLLCDYRPEGAATVCAHIDALQAKCRHRVFVLSMLGDIPTALDLDRFDAVIIHYSLVVANDYYLSPLTRLRLHYYKGLKIMFIQDEYRWVNATIDAMRYIGVNLLFTCVPEKEIDKVYTPQLFPGVRKVNVLTGYVEEPLTRLAPLPYGERRLDVGYRGRRLSAWYGELARAKWLIVDRFKEDAQRFGLTCDLSYFEADRLYGQDWIDFIRSCRAVLGTESGASVVDFAGTLQEQVEGHEARHPDTPFETLRDLYFRDLDGVVKMNQISPRCFEAAVLRTLMILYEGDYSGILKPWRHYVPLRKDHGNMEEVVAALRNESLWKSITDNAYAEIACNPRYSFAGFMTEVERAIEASWSEAMAAAKTPYTEQEFAALAGGQAVGGVEGTAAGQAASTVDVTRTSRAPHGPISAKQRQRRLFERLHKLTHRWVLDRLPYTIRGWVRATFRMLYRFGTECDARARNILRWCVLPPRIPFWALLVSRLHGYRLLDDLEHLLSIQQAGRACKQILGRSPFVLAWDPKQGRLALLTELDLQRRGDGDAGSCAGVFAALESRQVCDFVVDIGDPNVARLIHSRPGDWRGLIWFMGNCPGRAESVLFHGPAGNEWLDSVVQRG